MKEYKFLNPQSSLLFVIDLQDRLLNAMYKPERVIKNTILMIQAAKILNIPIVTTTQYKKGLGDISPSIKELITDFPCIDKIEFNAFLNPEIDKFFKELPISIDTVLITGVEAHICVYQTAVAAKIKGFKPWVISDAISSREKRNIKSTMIRFSSLGIDFGPAEMAVYELLKKAGTSEFKQIIPYVK